MNLRRKLESRVSRAMAAAGAPEDAPALVMPARRPEFGDYQANGVIAVAKGLKTNGRQFAEKVVAALNLDDLAEKVEIAGPGFINITLKAEWLQGRLGEMHADGEQLGVAKVSKPLNVVVDYSGPNLAKEMHVGHLRSTIIGDALAGVLDFLGHDVTRQNHVGDWGTQFGMLTAYMGRIAEAGHVRTDQLSDLEEFYRKAKELFDSDDQFADTARQHVVRLQSGDERMGALWREYVDCSLAHCEAVYERLGVSLRGEHVRGESSYNDDLANVVADLDKEGVLKESDGAQCVFLDGFKGTDGKPLPLIVRKSDGGYLYATTDLAALRYRVGELKADRILYVTDSRQSLHFRQVFAVAREAGFVPKEVSLEHVGFGMMLGADNRPFKTRTGGTVKLIDLLDQAESRALEMVCEKNPDLPAEQQREIARAVGIGAVKYADLSQNRTSDYVFSWDRMLSLDGNTAPYMQYAYARVRSIFRKGRDTDYTEKACDREGAGILIGDPAERALAVKLAQLPEIIQTVADESLPHILCGYLFELAGLFMGFYENCPVLQSDEPVRSSRLALCRLTARVIKKGLNLLGIETLEQM